MKTDNEIKYMICDDTIDVGKEPLPILTKKDKRMMERAGKIIDDFLEKMERTE